MDNELDISSQKSGTPKRKNTIGAESHRNGYLIRKVSDTGNRNKDWQLVHRLIWKEAGREIPPGHVIVCRDGNSRNISLENLELISKAELLQRMKDEKKRLMPPKKKYNAPWTKKEEEKIAKLYRHKTAAEIGKILGRTYFAVRNRFCVLGLNEKYPVWTQEMDDDLTRLYQNTPAQVIAKKLNKTLDAVYRRSSKLGLRRESAYWKQEEDEMLKRCYHEMNTIKLSEMLGRTSGAIGIRAAQLGLRKIWWTPEENSFLINNYHKMTRKQIAEAMGKSLMTIAKYIKKNGLQKRYRWTVEEDLMLRKLYPKTPLIEIARLLNRTISGVWNRIKKMKRAKIIK